MNEIDLKTIDLNLLCSLNCIYREDSFTRVGTRLGRTQSAVSHALERLRALFSDPLFVRTPTGYAPHLRSPSTAPTCVCSNHR